MTLLVWLLVLLTHCPERKVVKPQKEPLTRHLHTGKAQDPLISHLPITTNMIMTRTFLLHEKSKQSLMWEINSLILKVTTGRPLTQTFLLHGVSKVQGSRIQIQICRLHETDPNTRAPILISLHQGGKKGPNLLILICLHLEGVSLLERRLHTCILGPKLGWC